MAACHVPPLHPISHRVRLLYRCYAKSETLTLSTGADDNKLTIWFGPKGSPFGPQGERSNNGNTLKEWVWSGGGYKETMTRPQS